VVVVDGTQREVSIVIANRVGRVNLCRRTGTLLLISLAVVMSGCGSSQPTGSTGSDKVARQLKDEDLYHYVGTGANKKKVVTTRKQRTELLREAREKAGSQ
jgi:hypothetical protein